MSEFRKKLRRRRAYLPTIFSITLVLFLLGLFGALIVKAPELKEYVLENIQLTVEFKDDVNEPDIMRVKEQLSHQPFVKSAVYLTKEEILKNMTEYFGINPEALGDHNPAPNSLNVNFHAYYVNPDSLRNLKKKLVTEPGVQDVSYDQILVGNIDRNLQGIEIILLSLAVIMSLISIALIYNTIRLTLYAHRFIIKSMQLVGATQNFIRMPFLKRGFMLGVISGVLACGLLYATWRLLVSLEPDIAQFGDVVQALILFVAVVVLGILISTLAAFAAINKYLRMKLDDLF